ncbi:MAG: deoxyribose-phosphate aldolase [Clostridiales Family XIII bacterium]|jgi:deoxyribose-phosphate aldolase|nr:deoxyribose-phosphate aldolase [Clostridiales Family XIII bacterium]
MTRKEAYSHIDHTLLKAVATFADIEKLCDEALRLGAASVCVPPCYVRRIRDAYGDRLRICTVIGFPLGYSVTAAKLTEAKQALADGASEIDAVVNIADVKNGDYARVLDEIKQLRAAAGAHILKVIVETCYLSQEEKIKLCEIVTESGADYIKTSTGFGTAGAEEADIELFKAHIGPKVKIKASGGIRTVEALLRFLALGCDRVGASAVFDLPEEDPS